MKSENKTEIYIGSKNNVQHMMTTQTLEGVNLKDLDLSKGTKLGNGFYGTVYKLQDTSGNTSDKFVVKKIKLNFIEQGFNSLGRRGKLPFNLQLGSVLSKRDMFLREVKTLNKLQSTGVVPKIYYADTKRYIYVMERMDYTLYSLLKPSDNPKVSRQTLTPEMGHKLLELVDKYFKTPIFHTDLHLENVMWSDKLGEWRIIDWGYYRTIPTVEGNNTKINKTSSLYKEKIGETMEVNDRILKALWNYCKFQVSKGGADKPKWEYLINSIREYITQEFPNNSKKYIKYLDSKLRGYGFTLFGGKGKKTNKKNKLGKNKTRRR